MTRSTCLAICILVLAGCDETARPWSDGAVTDGPVSPDTSTGADAPASADVGPRSDAAQEQLQIVSPKASTPLPEGATITLQGTGQGTLTWSYDANSDGLGEITIGTGASVSFTIPTGVTGPRTLVLSLADTSGKVQQNHTIAPLADAGPPADGAAPPADSAPPPADSALPPADSAPPPVCTGFVEAGGLVVMEVESAPVVPSWTKRTSVTGHTGTGYYEWKYGDSSTTTDAAGQGILSYSVCVTTTGRYQLHLRSAAPNSTEHNDVWVRFPDTGAVRSKGGLDTSLGASWFKVYQNTSNDLWQWKTKTKDNDAHDIFVDVTKARGLTVELSGRSTQFKVDRVVLRHASVAESDATKTTNPQSAQQ